MGGIFGLAGATVGGGAGGGHGDGVAVVDELSREGVRGRIEDGGEVDDAGGDRDVFMSPPGLLSW